MTRRLGMPFVGDAHAYTRSEVPWRLDRCEGTDEVTPGADGRCRRLFRYLSGGGVKAFGRTSQQDEADFRRGRFLAGFGIAAAVWLYFWI